MKKVFILGGGLTGLVIAEQLQGQGFDVAVLEKESSVGGMCKTKEINGIKYDLGPHKFASFEKEATDYFVDIVKRPIVVYKSSKIFLKGLHLQYPIRITEILKKMPMVGIRCGIGYMCAFFRLDGNTYEKYMKKRFGGYVYEMAFKGYANKVWGDPKLLDAELAKTRMAATSLIDMLMGMITNSGAHSFGNFFYCSGGIGDFVNAIKDKAVFSGAKIYTDVSEISIAPGSKEICFHTGKDGMSEQYDILISTIKPQDLSSMLKMDMKLDMFRSRDIRLLYCLVDRNKINFDDTWRFFPEEKVVFNRISKNWSPNMVPEGKMCLCTEVTGSDMSNDDVYEELFKYLGVSSSEAGMKWQDSIKGAYPVYHKHYQFDVSDVMDAFSKYGIFCIGRNACHNYNNMDHAILEAKDLAEIIKSDGTIDDWIDNMSNYEWKIVD